MRRRTNFILILALMLMAAYSSIAAQDETLAVGAPDEIKAMGWLIGEWDVASEFRMSEESDEWMKAPATAIYEFSNDSCLIEMDYISNYMGMPFSGKFLQSYDRHAKQHQTIWTDNFGARMSYYTGYHSGDSTVLSGDEFLADGSKVVARVITYNETENSFNWQMDMSSDGGKTFWTTGKATYTKKK